MPQVQLPDFTMHYVEVGMGPLPIVFVHGFISTRNWWRPTLERLAGDRYHAYAIDLRAAGESEQALEGHTLAQYAQDVQAFAEAMGLSRFVLVGHSMGGGVAMQYALDHPERLAALLLVDPLAPFGMNLAPDVVAQINAQQGSPEGIRALVLGAFATPPAGDYLELLVAEGVRWEQPIYFGTMEDMARFDVAGRLSEIVAPTLVTWGDRDTVVPFVGIVEVFTKIPGCGLQVWHGVGHSGPIEIPDRFVALLDSFIAESQIPRQ